MAGQKRSITLLERIHAKSSPAPSGCIEWVGYVLNGYGRIRWKGQRLAVHRVVYEHYHGPLGDLCVCHECDNPRCVNPDHLFSGTRAENNADKVRKGRQAKGSGHGVQGEKNHFAKLTAPQVLAIRAELGLTQRQIAAKYGISPPQVSNILNRKEWSHV